MRRLLPDKSFLSFRLLLLERVNGRISEVSDYFVTPDGDFRIRKTTEKEETIAKSELWIESTLVVQKKNASESKTVRHRQWTNWPDRGVPATGESAVEAVLALRRDPVKPIIVHCSAGIGRTGTLVFIQMAMTMIDRFPKLSIGQLLDVLRYQRMSAVQNDEQYLYVHLAVLDYIRRHKIPNFADENLRNNYAAMADRLIAAFHEKCQPQDED